MHRIKIDENNPESDYERYLFDPKAELKDVPKFLKIKYPRDLSYDKQRPKYKRFMVMKTLKRPKTAAEKDSVIANAMLKVFICFANLSVSLLAVFTSFLNNLPDRCALATVISRGVTMFFICCSLYHFKFFTVLFGSRAFRS